MFAYMHRFYYGFHVITTAAADRNATEFDEEPYTLEEEVSKPGRKKKQQIESKRTHSVLLPCLNCFEILFFNPRNYFTAVVFRFECVILLPS